MVVGVIIDRMAADGSRNVVKPALVPVAFIDLDDTITDTKSDWLWATWRAARSPKGWVEMARLALMYGDYNRGRLKVEKLIKYQLYRVRGKSPLAFRAMALRFFMEKGEKHIYKDAIRVIQAQKEAGSKVVMLTAQHDIIASHFAQRLGMDDLIATHILAKNNRFTDAVKPYCYREGKVHWAKRYARTVGVDLSECAFYSDSINDVPMLEEVGKPVAVNPDPLLKAYAGRREWQIVSFEE